MSFSSRYFICFFFVLLLQKAEKRRLCYNCNSKINSNCRKTQNRHDNSTLCPPFENYCTIYFSGNDMHRGCTNIIRCPDREVRCCSCTEDYCNWSENCYEIEDDGHVLQVIDSPSLLVFAIMLTLCYNPLYPEIMLRV